MEKVSTGVLNRNRKTDRSLDSELHIDVPHPPPPPDKAKQKYR